ncbi:MAG TPA: LacI family DNA-binding transcriptional regulator [Edaphobacter sp.]|nr:LacI family DNA-binding transcriptional regulator [Edaphobacter sp.]
MARQHRPGNNGIDIHSVAAAARVSTATVSRTVNGKTSVSPVLQKRVWKAVTELGYIPNSHAKSLSSTRSKRLGLMISESANSCFTHLIRHFEDAAFLQGYDLLIGTVNAISRGTNVLVRHMIQRGVDGVAILTTDIEKHFIDLFLQHDIRTLLLTSNNFGQQINAVGLDMKNAVNQAVQHLAVLGHRDIAFVHGHRDDVFLEMPPSAFSIAMSKIGIAVGHDRIIEDSCTRHDDMSILQELLEQPSLPTAIVCSSDIVALKMLKAVYAKGLDVPGDISIIGVGDLYPARHANPSLTTIQMSQSDLASSAVSSLCRSEVHQREYRAEATRGISLNLIVRQSTSFPRNSILNRKMGSARFVC